jgi:hypothetical protein
MRHDPPWLVREWVLTEEGRQPFIRRVRGLQEMSRDSGYWPRVRTECHKDCEFVRVIIAAATSDYTGLHQTERDPGESYLELFPATSFLLHDGRPGDSLRVADDTGADVPTLSLAKLYLNSGIWAQCLNLERRVVRPTSGSTVQTVT